MMYPSYTQIVIYIDIYKTKNKKHVVSKTYLIIKTLIDLNLNTVIVCKESFLKIQSFFKNQISRYNGIKAIYPLQNKQKNNKHLYVILVRVGDLSLC